MEESKTQQKVLHIIIRDGATGLGRYGQEDGDVFYSSIIRAFMSGHDNVYVDLKPRDIGKIIYNCKFYKKKNDVDELFIVEHVRNILGLEIKVRTHVEDLFTRISNEGDRRISNMFVILQNKSIYFANYNPVEFRIDDSNLIYNREVENTVNVIGEPSSPVETFTPRHMGMCVSYQLSNETFYGHVTIGYGLSENFEPYRDIFMNDTIQNLDFVGLHVRFKDLGAKKKNRDREYSLIIFPTPINFNDDNITVIQDILNREYSHITDKNIDLKPVVMKEVAQQIYNQEGMEYEEMEIKLNINEETRTYKISGTSEVLCTYHMTNCM